MLKWSGIRTDVVDWHRRDAKPSWREDFRIRGLTEQELVDAAIPIGGLGAEVSKGRIQEKGSKSDRYEYPFPAQEYGIKLDDDVECPVTGQRLGTVIEIDPDANVVALKRTAALKQPPRAMARQNKDRKRSTDPIFSRRAYPCW